MYVDSSSTLRGRQAQSRLGPPAVSQHHTELGEGGVPVMTDLKTELSRLR